MKKTPSQAGKMGAEATHKKRHEAVIELSKWLGKDDLNWIQAKWKTAHILKLLSAYKHGKSN